MCLQFSKLMRYDPCSISRNVQRAPRLFGGDQEGLVSLRRCEIMISEREDMLNRDCAGAETRLNMEQC